MGALAPYVFPGGVYVRDGSGRWSFFDDKLQFQWKRLIAGAAYLPDQTAILPDGAILGWVTSGTGGTFRVVDTRGTMREEFGQHRSRSRRVVDDRPIAYAGGETFWTAVPRHGESRYVIEEWSIAGVLLRRLARRTEWFEAGDRTSATPSRLPSIVRVHLLDAELLLVIMAVPRGRVRGDSGALSTREADDESFDVGADLIDTVSGRVLASLQVPRSDAELFLPRGVFNGTSHGYAYVVDEMGLPRVDIVTLQVRQRAQ